MHLTATTDTAAPLRINYSLPAAPEADTFCPNEDAALREVVAHTHLGGDLLPTVQSAVVHAKMVRGQNWTCEARHLLAEFGLAPQSAGLMHA